MIHLLGLCSAVILTFRRILAGGESRQLELLLLGLGLGCLLVAGHVVYLIFFAVIAVLEYLSYFLIVQPNGQLILSLLHHVVVTWFLPIISFWGIAMNWGSELFSQEIGHLFNSTFEFVVLFVLPVVLTRAFPNEKMWLQISESIALIGAGFIGGSIEATVIYLRDRESSIRDPAFWHPDADLHHILTSFLWGSFGVLGIGCAVYNQPTNLHVAGGAVAYGAIMLGHTAGEGDKYIETWNMLHMVSASLFICAAILRYSGNIIEASVVFLCAAFAFTFAARQLSHFIAENFRTGHISVMALAPFIVIASTAQLLLVIRIADIWRHKIGNAIVASGNEKNDHAININSVQNCSDHACDYDTLLSGKN